VVQASLYPYIQNSTKKLALQVQRTAAMNDTAKTRYIKDALVLYYENNQLRDTLTYSDSLKKYVIANKAMEYPIQGNTYSITVEKQGYATVRANTIIPSVVPLSKIEVLPVAYFDETHSAYSEITLHFTDPNAQTNFYEIVATGNFSLYRDFPDYTVHTNDKIITGESYYPTLQELKNTGLTSLLFKDVNIQGKQVQLKMYYVPPQMIKGGKRYISQHILHVYLRNVSEAYYKHQTTLIEQVDKNSENILYGQSEPMQVYSNIENGYGLFAGYNYSIQTTSIPEIELK
jgi:hypothetical protein